ncbi:protein NDNF-like [Daktulosphaira vitifoliae]|uniref:protein NDNF-like n=1 Tax=Daktulosphaira vitifoliae TaxID=58002 RepID=UPI0021A9F088|nr:protein NDNF-like [Daktulosphaira vitifoliae]
MQNPTMVTRLWLAVLMAELLLVVKDTTAFEIQLADMSPRIPIPTSLPKNLVLLQGESTFTGLITKLKKDIYVLIPQETEQSLTLTVTPCSSKLNWFVKFIPNEKNQQIQILGQKFSELGTKLKEYTAVSIPSNYHRPIAKPGLYVITVQAVDDELQVRIDVTYGQKSPFKPLGFYPSEIKIRRGGQKVFLRWKVSQIDYHLIEYYLIISTSKIYSTLCEAEGRLEEKQKLISSSDDDDDISKNDRLEIQYLRNKTNYTLTDLVYNKTYFFTVFAVNGSRITAMQYATAVYTFLKPKPLGLKDAKPKVVNLRALSGKVSFRYKVAKKSPSYSNNTNTLYWYVMSCNGVVDVEIRHKKIVLLKKRVFGYEKIILNGTQQGERYVLKVKTVSVDETQLVKTVEVLATVHPELFPMPEIPSDLSLKQYEVSNDCKSVTIGWLPAKSDEIYCVYKWKYRYSNNIDFWPKPDQCSILYGRNRRNDIVLSKKKCYTGDNLKVNVKKILQLQSSSKYVIQVTVTKPRGRTLSYDLLMLDTNICGLN